MSYICLDCLIFALAVLPERVEKRAQRLGEGNGREVKGVHEALERGQRQIGRLSQEDPDRHAVKTCRVIS